MPGSPACCGQSHLMRASHFFLSALAVISCLPLDSHSLRAASNAIGLGLYFWDPTLQKGGAAHSKPCGMCGCAFALTQLPNLRCRIRLWSVPGGGGAAWWHPPQLWDLPGAGGQQGLTWHSPPFFFHRRLGMEGGSQP